MQSPQKSPFRGRGKDANESSLDSPTKEASSAHMDAAVLLLGHWHRSGRGLNPSAASFLPPELEEQQRRCKVCGWGKTSYIC